MITLKNKKVWLIVLFYTLWTNCFNFYLFSDLSIRLSEIKELVMLALTIGLYPLIKNSSKSVFVDSAVAYLIFMAVFSMVTALFFWGQSPYASLRAMSSLMFPLSFFFLLRKCRVEIDEMISAIIVLAVLHGVLQIIGALTFPYVIFGYAGKDAIERSLQDLNQRGVLRLAVPGADFIPLTMFSVMYFAKFKKKNYLFLLPLGIILLMRGTRTPFFIAIAVCLIYYFVSLKRKWLAILLFFFSSFLLSSLYNTLLNSNSDNALVNYVQLSNNQIENDDEDIRVSMANYYLSDFNKGNILKNILGNGIPGNSQLGNAVSKMSEFYSYWIVDVGFVEIFVYFGLLGFFVYFYLLRKVIKADVPKYCIFAKLGIYYFFIILPTNSMLLSNPIPVAMALYVIYRGEKDNYYLKKYKGYDRNRYL